MLKPETRLKKVSDDVFQEADPPKDRHKPLEWRRSFNSIFLELDDVRIVTSVNVQEVTPDIIRNLRAADTTGKKKSVVTPKAETKRIIFGNVTICRDKIFCAVEENKDSQLYRFERPSHGIAVRIEESGEDAPFKSEKFPNGIYAGSCTGIPASEFNEDHLWIECSVPPYDLQWLCHAIENSDTPKLTMTVALDSFSYEVDDALREWYHSRTLFIGKNSVLCVPENISVSSAPQKDPKQYYEDDFWMSLDAEDHNEKKGGKGRIMLARIGNVIYYPCAVIALFLVLLGIFGTHADDGIDFLIGGGFFAVGWGIRYALSGNKSFR